MHICWGNFVLPKSYLPDYHHSPQQEQPCSTDSSFPRTQKFDSQIKTPCQSKLLAGVAILQTHVLKTYPGNSWIRVWSVIWLLLLKCVTSLAAVNEVVTELKEAICWIFKKWSCGKSSSQAAARVPSIMHSSNQTAKRYVFRGSYFSESTIESAGEKNLFGPLKVVLIHQFYISHLKYVTSVNRETR